MQLIIRVTRILPFELISYHQKCTSQSLRNVHKLYLLAFPEIFFFHSWCKRKFTAKDSHWHWLFAPFLAKSSLPSSIFFSCNTRLPPYHLIRLIYLFYLFAVGPAQRLLTAWWRHSEQKRLIASTARAAWPGCSRTGEEQTGRGGAPVPVGFYFHPPPCEKGAGV